MTKNTKTQTSVCVQNCKKEEIEIFAFCVITFETIRLEQTKNAPITAIYGEGRKFSEI